MKVPDEYDEFQSAELAYPNRTIFLESKESMKLFRQLSKFSELTT